MSERTANHRTRGQPPSKISAVPGKSGSSGVYRLDTGVGWDQNNPAGDVGKEDDVAIPPQAPPASVFGQPFPVMNEEEEQYRPGGRIDWSQVPGAGTISQRSSGDVTIREQPGTTGRSYDREFWNDLLSRINESKQRRMTARKLKPLQKSISPNYLIDGATKRQDMTLIKSLNGQLKKAEPKQSITKQITKGWKK